VNRTNNRPPAPAGVPSAPAAALTKEEQAMLLSFRTMDARGKSDIAKLAARLAERHPHVPRPTLRLVSGGAQ
jgi:hypothetical protein